MEDIRKLKSYADLRNLVTPEAYIAAMNYLAWHNRLKMTHMLPVWQALIVALCCEQKPVDQMLYRSIKSFLDENDKQPPEELHDCRRLAGELKTFLAGSA